MERKWDFRSSQGPDHIGPRKLGWELWNFKGKLWAYLTKDMTSDLCFLEEHSGCSGLEVGQSREKLGAIVSPDSDIGNLIFSFWWIRFFLSVFSCSSQTWRPISVLCKMKILVFENIRKYDQRLQRIKEKIDFNGIWYTWFNETMNAFIQ